MTKLMKALVDAVVKTQPNGSEMLYFSGKSLGRRLAGRRFGDGKELMKAVNTAFKRYGIGGIMDCSISANRIILRINECGMKCRGRCLFHTGMIAGMVSEGFQRNFIGKKTGCESSICRIKLIPKDKF